MRNHHPDSRYPPFRLAAVTAVMLVLLGAAATEAGAQEGDARWLPFVGCWEAVDAEDSIGLLCFTPAGGGVDLVNYVDGEVASTERLAADGQPRTIQAEGCDGWESVEFSQDGRRAFTRTEFTCSEGSTRSGTGVMALTAPDTWVDVRVLDMDGEEVAWVQEYRLAAAERLADEGVPNPAAERRLAVRSARMAAAAPIDLEDVMEASSRMDERAVETWLVAEGDELEIDADALVRLDDAGVPDRVIDAAVAVSYPDRFMVEAGGDGARMADAPRPKHYRGYMGFDPWFGPAFGVRYGGWYGYSPFSPFGYSPWYGGYGYRYWGSRPGVVIIDRRPSSSGGRVYNGRGYRQGSGSTGRAARPRGGSSPSFSTGGSRSGSVAPTRSGTTRRATPRKAKRRGGGSGDPGGF